LPCCVWIRWGGGLQHSHRLPIDENDGEDPQGRGRDIERREGRKGGKRKRGKGGGEKEKGKGQGTIPERLFATFSPGTLALCGLWA